jgi:hypothetical protein
MVSRMGISIAQLCQRYPVLYHMASFGSWPLIKKHGLLSTSKLVELFEVPEPRRTELLSQQRRRSEPITHPSYGTAILRDQKPLSAKNLTRCLVDCDAPTWYRLLNERVFFWLDQERLMTLMSAREYSEKQHTVLQVNTASLVERYEKTIELAHMNTGNTRPMPHPRGRLTFRKMDDYDYQRRRSLPDYSAVVELTVLGGVPDISQDLLRVENAASKNGAYKVAAVLFRK